MADLPPWIFSDGRRISHTDLRLGAARAAAGFRALGVEEDDAVAILLGNGTPALEASLGAALLGAHPVPVDPGRPPDDIAFILADCAVALAVVGAGAPAPPGVRALAVEDVDAWER